MEKNVYLDNAAATRLDERVLEAMKKYFFEVYAVATSEFGYSLGIEAREALEEARGVIANKLGAEHDEIVFTSGSTESSNMAIKGVALALKEKKGKHIIVSKIEDFPVLNSAKSLEKQGFEITYLDVDQHGLVNFEQLENSIRNDTILVSIQHANQEIGTLQDINRIGNLCKQKGVLFHTDATHTFTRIPIDVKKIHANLITVSAHTIHGPKETGALFIRKNTPLTKWMDGGFQEFNKRAGLENIRGAVGFAKAVELVTQEENNKLQQFRDYLIKRVLTEIPNTTLNGHLEKRIPHNANITFHYVEGESITLHLDMRGFSVSTGSACFSKSLEASHVIMGIGGDHERAHGSVRFTFGRYNTMEDVNSVVDNISEVVEELRKISPLGKNS
ncbi:MAG: cysteine desulfurase [Candidatus Methanofastidiosa archaeon]|nr:cysteine desulfurase [Candidatus Methanofastidiosa archaeon]